MAKYRERMNKGKRPHRCTNYGCKSEAKHRGKCWYHFRQYLKSLKALKEENP